MKEWFRKKNGSVLIDLSKTEPGSSAYHGHEFHPHLSVLHLSFGLCLSVNIIC